MPKTKLQTLTSMAGAIAALALVGCAGPTFNREWKRMAAPPAPTSDIQGRWEGTWRSEVNNHHGDLRCVVTKLSPEQYRFFYHATFWKILSGTYTITQSVQRAGITFQMSGGSDLGKLYGGQFTYEGEASPTNFLSRYRSKSDHGVFEMLRPEE